MYTRFTENNKRNIIMTLALAAALVAAALTAQMLRAGYGCHADSEEATYWQRVARSAGARRIEGVYDELP